MPTPSAPTSSGPLSRRRLLLGGAGALVIGGAGLLATSGPADAIAYATFASRARGGPVTWGLSVPPGVSARGLPVVLVLHGRGRDAHAAFDLLAMHRFVAAHVRSGGAPLAAVSVDGGSDTYWHPREGGDDPLAMITDELVPRLADAGLRTSSIAVTGWSMGGYGALLMARESGAGRLRGLRVAAASAASPALYPSYDASAAGAFDSADDWARWGALARRPGVTGVPLQVSCGTSDPFADQTRVYRSHARPTPAGGLSAGRHEGGYWRSLVPGQLRFLAGHLAVTS